MHFSTILAGCGTLLSFALASPTSPLLAARHDTVSFAVFTDSNGEIESFKNAEALGVDIYGPIPDDGVVHADHVTAEPGTKAWAWIRAQADIDWAKVSKDKRDAVLKRQGWANIGIGMYAQDNCGGQASYFDNVEYGTHHFDVVNYYSIGITYRGLRDGETLGTFRQAGDDWCGTFVNNIAHNANPGCGAVGPINCFILTLS
ncbi:hypothetical protein D7B24_004125 [Verticillium nonalfalfae]|uniref:Uncharacterized protein n=1 Tax=Verticillium nonalfalfae TaxID=1051616 RepID=A0A3M9YFS3_9PEZI|nr:uncharacterized protein D7B24_004125 [Verticillium nonalfalfae]RNJ58762.1 hypothetical protein D7B24_004125 [Verticillium nonalfalfae]